MMLKVVKHFCRSNRRPLRESHSNSLWLHVCTLHSDKDVSGDLVLEPLCACVYTNVCVCVFISSPADSEGGERCQGHEYGVAWDWEGVICCVSHQFCLVKRSQQSHPTLLQGHIMDPLMHLPRPPPPASRLLSPLPSLPPTGAPRLSLPPRHLTCCLKKTCTLCVIANSLHARLSHPFSSS